MKVGRVFHFSASHFLPRHEGLCKNLHGHNYKMIVELEGELIQYSGSPEYGMVIDFKNLDKMVKELIVEKLDHTHLNDSFDYYPTVEMITSHIFHTLETELPPGVHVSKVKVWENHKSYALLEKK